jgi:lipoprotein NlpI
MTRGVPPLRRHRRHALWIALPAAGVALFFALQAPAVAPPDLDRALAAQRTLAAERPGDPQVLNDLGNLLVLADRPEEAESAYRQALELAPEMISARYNLGLLLLQTERPKEALAEFRKVVEAEPDHAWAHYQIGAIYDQRGSEHQAVKEYGKAFRLDPQLAFPEINPHVIENEHVTEAMLLAYRDLPLVARVPKAYEDPSRIVNLMVPSSEAEQPAQETQEAAPGEPGVGPTPAFTPGTAGEPVTPPAKENGESGERVLREKDLQQGGTVNQIVVPGGVYQPPRGGVRVPPVRTYTPPNRTTPGNPANGRPRGAVPEVPQGRQRFVPGVPSTGRLEVELFPSEGDPTTPAG